MLMRDFCSKASMNVSLFHRKKAVISRLDQRLCYSVIKNIGSYEKRQPVVSSIKKTLAVFLKSLDALQQDPFECSLNEAQVTSC